MIDIDASEVDTRCGICETPFEVLMDERGQIVCTKDGRAPLHMGEAGYVHASCLGHQEEE